MSLSFGTIIPVQRASWWARMRHWLDCGGGYWVMDTTTGEHTCGFCGFRAQWPTNDEWEGFQAMRSPGLVHVAARLRARAHRLTRRG